MTQKTSPFVEVNYGWSYGESGWNDGMDKNLLKFSFLAQNSIDGILSSLPSSPANGVAYFITSDKRIYYYVVDSWYSLPTPIWKEITIKSTGVKYKFDGTNLVQLPDIAVVSQNLTNLQTTVNSLGTAAYQNISYFVVKTDLQNSTPLSVPSIATLRTTPTNLSLVATVLSYYAGESRRDMVFDWVASSVASDDGGSVIAVAGITTGRWIRRFPTTNSVNCYDFGVRTGVLTDQVAQIKSAVAFAAASGRSTVSMVPGDVYISLESNPAFFGAGIIMPTGIFLDLRGSKLKALPTTSSGYSVVLFKEDCLLGGVFGGEIVGERDGHLGSGGEFGMGINIRAAKNIFVRDIKISKCWGDGLYLGADTTGNQSTHAENITIDNIVCDLNRRNGISITNALNVIGDNIVCSNTIGTSPQAGIDIESDSGGSVRNIQFGSVHCFGNSGAGFMTFASISGPNPLDSLNIKGIQVANLVCTNNAGVGVQLSLCSDVQIGSIFSEFNSGKGVLIDTSLRVKMGAVDCKSNTVTGQFQRGDLTITGSRQTQIAEFSSSAAGGASALIVRGSDITQFGHISVSDGLALNEAAVQVEVGSSGFTANDISLNNISGYGIYCDSSVTGLRLKGGRLKDIGKTNVNAIGILNQSNLAIITGFELTNTSTTKPATGISSSGNYCNVFGNIIPTSQVSGGLAQTIVVTGTGSISTASNITAG